MICGIYLIRHSVSGKCYVGQSVDIPRRWSEHRSPGDNEPSPIGRAIRKHGKEAFEFSVLEECPRGLLNERETFFIKMLNTLSPDGYNLNGGGNAREAVSQETRKRLSERQTATQSLVKNRQRQSRANKKAWACPELRAAASSRANQQWGSPDLRKRVIEGNQQPEVKAKKSKQTASRWATDPAYREKMLKVLSENRARSKK